MHEQSSRGATNPAGLLRRLGYGGAHFDRFRATLADAGFTFTDGVGIVGIDAAGCGVALACLSHRQATLSRATRMRWTRVGVHLAAAARLRRALQAPASQPEAVLRPSGHVEHAEGDAKKRAARTAPRDRAVAIDRARGRLRRSDPDAALETWRGLVSGRWSLVDRFESDGRRYVVAHRNEAAPARMLALTLRERQVVGHVLLGHSSKLVAYTLGVSAAAVSASLQSALQKIAVRNAAQLLEACGGIATNAPARTGDL